MAEASSNLVKVFCPCGAKLRVKPEGLGRKARCPKCKEVFLVRPAEPPPEQASASDSLLDELAAMERSAEAVAQPEHTARRACPHCGESMPADGVLCTSCGYNVQTGKVARQASARRAAVGGAARRLAKGAGGFALGSVLSCVAALVGALIWFGVAIYLDLEIGWIAWAVGVLAGGGMLLGYQKRNARAGLVASGAAIGGMLTGKTLVFVFVLRAVLTGATDDMELKREYLTLNMTEQRLADLGAWAQEDREREWTAAYDHASGLVAIMSDEIVERRCEALRSEENDAERLSKYGAQWNQLASDRAARRIEEQGLAPWNPARPKIYQEELARAAAMTDEETEAAFTEHHRWKETDRWEDEPYVRNHLINVFANREMDGTPYLFGNDHHWKGLQARFAKEVDEMEPAERVDMIRQAERETELAVMRSRLAAHRAEMECMRLGLRYYDEQRDAIYDQQTQACAEMEGEELDAAIAALDAWEAGGKWEDAEYVEAELTYHFVQAQIDEVEELRGDYWDPADDEWRELYQEAAAQTADVPPGERAARIQQLEQERQAAWERAARRAEWEAVREAGAELGNSFFAAMFNPFDALFLLLAVMSAYGIAAGTGEEGLL